MVSLLTPSYTLLTDIIQQKRQNKETNLVRDRQNKGALHAQRMGWIKTDEHGHLRDINGKLIDPSPPSPPNEVELENAGGVIGCENMPPRQAQGNERTPSSSSIDPVTYDPPTPGSPSQLQGRQMSFPTPTRVRNSRKRARLSVPTPSTEGFSLGSVGATVPRATTDGYMQPSYSAQRVNPIQNKTYPGVLQNQDYPWGPSAAGQNISVNIKPEPEDPDDQWYP